ncbi:hypothetical protein O6H91_06G103400 [Diphasiastrum complanatum]|uniref:Uncharacterized protein n=1 Tax=Diphasiastrum complanatum TaxID=34168 RepID=A0ACC2DH98_DIPCM|nr:hypothetical protein O6H91_06G103400 [Diphasiastrum complanatum]
MEMVGIMGNQSREQAVALLNGAKLQSDMGTKVDTLKQLKELVLHKDPWMLPEFVPHLMELQTNPGSPVRKYIAEIIEDIGLKYVELLPLLVPTLLVLLRDETPAVARRAIASGTNLFRNTLEQVALKGIHSGHPDKSLEDGWSWMVRFKDAVFPLAFQKANDGVRFHAVKFVETTILLFTSDPSGSSQPPLLHDANGSLKGFNMTWITSGHPMLDAMSLGQEASKNLGLLLNQLRPPEISSVPGPVAIVLVNSLAAIAKRRPSLYGRILPTLLSLGPSCESIKGGQVASVVHALKNALLSLLKCTHSGAAPWRERLLGMLRLMDAGDIAEAALRQIDKSQRNSDKDHSSRDPRPKMGSTPLSISLSTDMGRKRPIIQENGTESGGQFDTNNKRLRSMPSSAEPLSGNQHQQIGGDAREDVASLTDSSGITVPLDKGLSPLQQMIAMIGALVAQGERAAASVDLLISTLPPDTLADVVIANMQNLPATAPPLPEGVSAGGGDLASLLPLQGTVSPVESSAQTGPSLQISMPETIPASLPAADVRRDPRRDPRRMDPRRGDVPVSTALPSPKIEETVPGGTFNGIDAMISKGENIHVVSNRDPRSALQTRSMPKVTDIVPVKVKLEPGVEAPLSSGNLASMPATVTVTATTVVDISTSLPISSPPDIQPMATVKSDPMLSTITLTPVQARGPSISSSVSAIAPPAGVAFGGTMVIPVMSLTDDQQALMGKAAFMRILEGHKSIAAAGGGHLRIALLARLASQLCRDDGALDIIQNHILADYMNHMGHELALHVLYELYLEQASDPDSSVATIEAYQKFLFSLAEGLRDSLPASDKSLSKLLGEVPLLPLPVLKLLEGLCNPTVSSKDGKEPPSSDRVTQGLSALWSLILQRPPTRETCLNMALQCAVHGLDDVRAKAIRLVANKLYPLDYVSQRIEEFATTMLLSVVDPQHPVDGRNNSKDVEGSESMQTAELKQQEGGEKLEPDIEQRTTDAAAVEVTTDASLQKNSGTNSNVSMLEAQRCMSLYFALCTKKHSLLERLFSVYGRAPKPVKQAIHRHIPILIRTIGSSSADLLKIISDPPAASENLLLPVIHSLTEGSTPSTELIRTVKQLYETKLKDAVFLIPILSALSKDEVLPIFPRLVDLPPEKFQVALARILQGSAHTGPALTPAEVLIALHGIDHQRDSVPLKKVTDACSACLQQRTVFTQQVLAKVLNQLVEQTPLPLLFMRTVIQAIGAFPSLVNFVMEILSRLVNKQIWKFPQLWVGFLKCANQTAPDSFHVLLQLPSAQLENALTKFPSLKSPLAAHATQAHIRSTVPRSSLLVLGVAQEAAATDNNTTTIQQSGDSSSALKLATEQTVDAGAKSSQG